MENTFSNLIDSILVILYRLKSAGKSDYYGLKSIFKTLKYPFTYGDIYQVAKYLHADGLVTVLPSLGDAYIEITTQGVITTERRKSTWPEYYNFVKELESTRMLENIEPYSIESIFNTRKDILEKVKEIRNILKSSLKDDKADIFFDLDGLDAELRKLNPNKEVIISKLYSLNPYSPVRLEVRQLMDMLDLDINHESANFLMR